LRWPLQGAAKPIYYAAVAGDVLGTYTRWRAGRSDERQTGATYSSQFFDLCVRLGRRGAVSYPAVERTITPDDRFVLRSRPLSNAAGLRFYLHRLRVAVWLLVDVLRTGASDIVIMDGVTSFFMLAPLAWAGRRIFLSVHTVLWRDSPPSGGWRAFLRNLDRWFFRHHCAGCLAASPAIADQIRQLTNRKDFPLAMFYPLYERADFQQFGPPNPAARPFRIFFAGRIESNKGVFDLLDNVRALVAAGRDICLDYCGDGTALPELRKVIATTGLANQVFAHGHLDRPNFLEKLERAQIVVVPTRSSFPEGLNQVVIEAVLARRPVVTSAICPALSLISDAAVEAIPDDVESYRRAIEQLIDDPAFFAEKVAAGTALREEFFDPQRAWTAQATEMLAHKSLIVPSVHG
jgi:glycosyltransferase involved in cell wall biosynthesis